MSAMVPRKPSLRHHSNSSNNPVNTNSLNLVTGSSSSSGLHAGKNIHPPPLRGAPVRAHGSGGSNHALAASGRPVVPHLPAAVATQPHPPQQHQPHTARNSNFLEKEKAKDTTAPEPQSARVGSSQRTPPTVPGYPGSPTKGDGEHSRQGSLSGYETMQRHMDLLTGFERKEVVDYETVYYCGDLCQQKINAPVPGVPNSGFDDERGDYIVLANDHIGYRYQILSLLGKGSFGQVLKALDHKTKTHIALKIIRNKKRFHQQAAVEVKVLCHLRDRDPDSKYGIIRMLDHFMFRNHVCMSFELLSINLYEYMKLQHFAPMPLHIVKKIGASVLISLAFMWRENIIHCDVKPENILLKHSNRTGVKVIDLGSSCFENERIYTYIQSRFYRAPEIMLGISYTRRIDLWSYGCVLVELASGYPLFPGENEQDQMSCIMEYLGIPPKPLLDRSPRRSNFFSIVIGPDGESSYLPKCLAGSRRYPKVREPGVKSLGGFLGLDESHQFIDFVKLFLQWDAEDRPSPEAAMRHPWICDAYIGVTPRAPAQRKRISHPNPLQPHPPAAIPKKEEKDVEAHTKDSVPTLPNIYPQAHR